MRTKMRKNLMEKMVIMLKTRRTLVEIMKIMSSIWIIMCFNHLNFLIDFMIEFLIEFPYMIDFSFIFFFDDTYDLNSNILLFCLDHILYHVIMSNVSCQII